MSAHRPDRSNRESSELAYAIGGLSSSAPSLSAKSTFSLGQVLTISGILGAVVISAILAPEPTGITLVSIATLFYVANLTDRIWLFANGVESSPEIRFTRAQAMSIADEDLPVYTVLVPAFNEPEVVERLMVDLGALDYPRDRLQILLLLEADDTVTVGLAQSAVRAGILDAEILLVPAAAPRTKPKACNFGLQHARGEFITIFDAEDLPEPLQLRRAVLAFRSLPPDTVCIQAKLSYYNDQQNLLTRWFTSEYDQWFGYILPGLMRNDSPIPLGGTSNHIRTSVLREAGGWDPFNVTEDADLGIRLARLGYRTAILDSVTLEEANSDTINWIRQRSRWYKGYLQTFLVHTRRPGALIRDLGWTGTLRFVSVTAGTPFLSLINVLFWTMALAWELGRPAFIRPLFPQWIFYPAMMSLFFGNSAVVYCAIIAARLDRNPRLLGACFLYPAYWVLMSMAAVKAFIGLLIEPSHWDKTTHGLDIEADIGQILISEDGR
jgi:cellulose synthase/poly-beta-1,6-N-acetylglucosamine synthase-like glycosyltransferase